MIKEKVVFIGVGQCGGNITKGLELKGYQCFYVNTSLDDLDSIDAPLDKRYHISGTKGMAKDINYAEEILNTNENKEKIVETIYKCYSNASIYFFITSSSGGTGSGMTISIANKMKEYYDEKVINIISVVPHEDEDIIMQYNAIVFFEKLKYSMDTGLINNVQILDNNKFTFDNKLELNNKYIELIDNALSFDYLCIDGNLDEQEFEKTFAQNGLLAIHSVSNEDFLENLDEIEKNSIFYKHGKDVQIHSLILNKEKNTSTHRDLIKEAFGVPITTHYTLWDKNINIIIPAGMKLQNTLINQLKKKYNNILERRNAINSLDETMEDINVDFSILANSSNIGLKSVKSETSNRGRRGRKVMGVFDPNGRV